MMDAAARGGLVRSLAHRQGFPLVGLARATPLDPAPFQAWLRAGHHAGMEYLADPRRLDPALALPGARTVAIFGLSYFDPSAKPGPISRYARGTDYHSVLRDKLRKLRKALAAADPGVHTYGSVDWGLVPEKAWAVRAGVGWIGKNGCLVTRTHGSWVLLAALILDRDCAPLDAPHEDFCGDCARCLPSCPTQAFPAPRVVDARRCLSFTTIEEKGPLPEGLLAAHAGVAFGCDLCQQSCPWNERFAQETTEPKLRPRPDGLWDVPLARIAGMDFAEWERRARGTSVARAYHRGLVRNALVAGKGSPGMAEVARGRLSDPDPGVRAAARFAAGEREPGDALPACGDGVGP